MPSLDKIRAGVERIREDEKLGATPRALLPVVKLLDVKTINLNVEIARKTEPEIADLLAKRDKAIDKVRSDATRHPELIKQDVKDLEARSNADLEKLLAKLGENSPLLEGQREHYSHTKCLQRTQFADAATQTAVTTRLSRLSSQALVEAGRTAVASADAATMGCIQDELDARVNLPTSDPRSVSREARAELNVLVGQMPSDAARVKALLDERDLIVRRARIASGRATRSTDKIAAGLLARQQQTTT
jgi:hypothetical protein